jgi:hypothetical protein
VANDVCAAGKTKVKEEVLEKRGRKQQRRGHTETGGEVQNEKCSKSMNNTYFSTGLFIWRRGRERRERRERKKKIERIRTL